MNYTSFWQARKPAGQVPEGSSLVGELTCWITFSIDGTRAYPSTGDVIDTSTKRIVATLVDEAGKDL